MDEIVNWRKLERPENVGMDLARNIRMLERPNHPVDVVLDTDTYNEIDDQFALAYLLQSSDQLRVQAVYAAPFQNHHAATPEEGMERSYEEILKVYRMIGREAFTAVTYKGASRFLPDEQTPVDSPAARDLVERAMQHDTQNPLYVIGIAAATNLASALLLEPQIADRVVFLWLGGLALEWHNNKSFNAGEDIAAARVLLGSGAPVVLFPGRNVVSAFTTTGPELEYWLRGKNAFCDYLIDIAEREAKLTYGGKVWSRALWDVTPVGWLLGEDFMLDKLIHSPIMQYDEHYSFDERRHFIKYVYYIHRDNLMEDLFDKLAAIQ